MGRPSKYTPKLGAEICTRLAGGESLRSIARDPSMPALQTILTWAMGQVGAAEEGGFPEHYARARAIRSELYADEIVELADAVDEDPQRSRLQVDARKWVASKLLPKTYGDKVSHEHSGPAGGPIPSKLEVVIVDPDDHPA